MCEICAQSHKQKHQNDVNDDVVNFEQNSYSIVDFEKVNVAFISQETPGFAEAAVHRCSLSRYSNIFYKNLKIYRVEVSF